MNYYKLRFMQSMPNTGATYNHKKAICRDLKGWQKANILMSIHIAATQSSPISLDMMENALQCEPKIRIRLICQVYIRYIYKEFGSNC